MTTAPDDRPDTAPGQELFLDARSLRAIAHPVRVRLLGLLREDGPSTATRLAAVLRLNSGATSYHLRQLAAYGLIAEDTERGSARDRWWRAVHPSTRYDVGTLLDSEPERGTAYLHAVALVHAERARAAVAGLPAEAPEWARELSLGDYSIRMTPAEAAELRAELHEVLARHHAAHGEDAPGSRPDADLYVVQVQAFRRPASEGTEDSRSSGSDR